MTRREIVVAGHFGEWLQGRLGPDGPVALVTLPCPALAVRVATASVSPADRAMARIFPDDRLRDFLSCLGLAATDLPDITCAMLPGAGAGASTATLVALARWAGYDGTPETLARACLATEGATDPLMWPQVDGLLWASREARAIRRTTPPPACEIVGGFWGPTLATDPCDAGFDDISDLARDWDRATKAGDLDRSARIATLSADRCTARRGPGDPMADLARDLGALGHVRAHTGSARGLIFAPDAIPCTADVALADAGLTGILRFRTGGS